MSFLLVYLQVLSYVECAKILGMFPIPSLSHQVVFQPLWKQLSLAGHEVTVITPNPLNDSTLTNLTEINVESAYTMFRRENLAASLAKDNYAIKIYMWLLDLLEENVLEEFQNVKTFLGNPKTQFDLLMVETHSPLVYALGCKFKVPIVAVSSLSVFLQTHDAVGNPAHPILAPDMFSNFIGEMTFYDKVTSVLQNLWYRLIYYWYFLPRSDTIAKKIWGECSDIGHIEKNVDLVLVNTGPVLHPIRPKVPNFVEMGQTRTITKNRLPKELQAYLDSSTQGVIYFSLGTNVRSIDLSPAARSTIIEVLSELPYNVLWKWENDSLPDKPKNVIIMKWFPQQDILKHKNIKVFVTQGGLQSMEEAITHCVPMVALPFISDQPLNVKKMVSLGIGKAINHVEITRENLQKALLEVAENDEYRKKIWKLKDLFSDVPVKGLEKSIWWIEYILKHNGAKYLRSSAADFSWFQYCLADVALFFFVLITITYLLVYLLFWKFK